MHQTEASSDLEVPLTRVGYAIGGVDRLEEVEVLIAHHLTEASHILVVLFTQVGSVLQ